jgi:hypothetical protein
MFFLPAQMQQQSLNQRWHAASRIGWLLAQHKWRRTLKPKSAHGSLWQTTADANLVHHPAF